MSGKGNRFLADAFHQATVAHQAIGFVVDQIIAELGVQHALGQRHFATLVRQNSTLLVSFETIQGIRALSENAQPFGFDMVRARGWSHLGMISNGDTWFRDPAVYNFMDRMTDDGLFDSFERVIFYGAGPCGYAAAAFSVAAPGSTVVAIQPQATLDPRMSEWDARFSEMRHLDFTGRYGYAPDMIDAAEKAFVLYDPRQIEDAMHATLFARPHVTRLRMPFMGGALQTQLIQMDILYRLLSRAGAGTLDARSFAALYRARRDNTTYLRTLLQYLDKEERPELATLLCRNVTRRLNAPRFRRRLEALEHAAAEQSDRIA